jgi:hypothetical protein
MGVISMAGRKRGKIYRVRSGPSLVPWPDAATGAESPPSDAMLRFVRALARAAAIADYNRHQCATDAGSDHEGSDLRKVQLGQADRPID